MTGTQLHCLFNLLGSFGLSAGWLLYHGWGDQGRPAIIAAKAMVIIGLAFFGSAVIVTAAFDAIFNGGLFNYLGDLTLFTSACLGIGAGTMVAGLILADKAVDDHSSALICRISAADPIQQVDLERG